MDRSAETLHAKRVLEVLHGQDAARSAVAASWRRSFMLHHLDPMRRGEHRSLSGAELREVRARTDHLLHIAKPGLDHLYQVVGGLGGCVLLTSAEGIPIDGRAPAADDAVFRRWGLCEGTVWSEEAEGTNGIGTCVAEQRPIVIHRDQHFLARNAGLTCIGAPIFDHAGKLISVLDVSSPRAGLGESLLGLISNAVTETARKIEAAHFRAHFPHARIALAPNAGGNLSALLAIDQDDLVIGATRAARLALGINDARLKKPLPAADLWGWSEASNELQGAERSALLRALARHDGNVTATAAALGISRATLHRKLAKTKAH